MSMKGTMTEFGRVLMTSNTRLPQDHRLAAEPMRPVGLDAQGQAAPARDACDGFVRGCEKLDPLRGTN